MLAMNDQQVPGQALQQRLAQAPGIAVAQQVGNVDPAAGGEFGGIGGGVMARRQLEIAFPDRGRHIHCIVPT
jgi:hypothetical protein